MKNHTRKKSKATYGASDICGYDTGRDSVTPCSASRHKPNIKCSDKHDWAEVNIPIISRKDLMPKDTYILRSQNFSTVMHLMIIIVTLLIGQKNKIMSVKCVSD